MTPHPIPIPWADIPEESRAAIARHLLLRGLYLIRAAKTHARRGDLLALRAALPEIEAIASAADHLGGRSDATQEGLGYLRRALRRLDAETAQEEE